MNRPSHWILAFLAVSGGVLWATGGLEHLVAEGRTPRPLTDPDARPIVSLRKEVAPAPAYAELRGRVVDRMGWPVVAAEVSVPGSDRGPVLTDAEGRFRMELSGVVQRTVHVAAPGRHDPVTVRGSLEEIHVVLQDALPWTEAVATTGAAPQSATSYLAGEGFLKDQNGAPVAAARIVVRPTGAVAQTDGNGMFVVPLPDGPCSLIAWDEQGRVATSEELRFNRKQGKVPVPDLVVGDGATLRGRVVDSDGAPLDGLTLIADNEGARHVAKSTADGAFVVSGLVSGATTLTAIPHDGFLGFRETLEIASDVALGDLPVARVPQEPLRIRVVDGEAEPYAFVHVVAEQEDGLRRAYGTTDAEGEVVLAGLSTDEPTLFEVRDADHQTMSIVGFEPERRALLVAR